MASISLNQKKSLEPLVSAVKPRGSSSSGLFSDTVVDRIPSSLHHPSHPVRAPTSDHTSILPFRRCPLAFCAALCYCGFSHSPSYVRFSFVRVRALGIRRKETLQFASFLKPAELPPASSPPRPLSAKK